MAGPLARLYALLGLDTSDFDAGLKSSTKKAKSFGDTFRTGIGLGAGFSLGAKAANVLTDAITGIPRALGDTVKAAEDEQVGMAQLTASLKANVEGWDGNIGAIEGVIRAREELAFNDDEQRQSLALLVAATKDVTEAQRLQAIAMDLSRLRNTELVETSTLVGKVYQGNLTALKRFGISLGNVKTPTEALAKIQQIAAGQAEAYAETNAGAAEVAEQAWANFSENVGGLLMDVAHDFQEASADIAIGLNELFPGPGADAFNRRLDTVLTPSVDTRRTLADLAGDTLRDMGIDLFPGMSRQLRIWEEIDEMAHAAGITFADVAPAIEALDAAFAAEGMSAEDAAKATDAVLREITHSLSMAQAETDRIAATGGIGLLGFGASIGTAIADAADKLNAPFATFAEEAPLAVEQTFADIRAEIKAGFGSVKEALRGGDRTIDPATRMRNMHNRLTEASRELRQAVEVGDPFGIAYWQAAVDKQRINLREYRHNTKDTQRDVIADARHSIADFSAVGREQGAAQGRAYRRALLDKMAAAVNATIQTIGQTMAMQIVNIGNVYGGPTGERELSNRLQRADRLARRDRG